MAGNLTSGPIQVIANDVASINDALAKVLEQIDSLRGLRGITALADQVTVSTPEQGDAAVRLDNLQALLSDPSDPFAAAQRVQPGQEDASILGPLDEALVLLLATRPAPAGGRVNLGLGVETMNLYASLAQIGVL